MGNEGISITSLERFENRERENDPTYIGEADFNGSIIDFSLRTSPTIKITCLNSEGVNVCDHTCKRPKNFYLDIEIESTYLDPGDKSRARKSLYDFIKGNGHI